MLGAFLQMPNDRTGQAQERQPLSEDAEAKLFAKLVERVLQWPCPKCGKTGLCNCYSGPDSAKAIEPENIEHDAHDKKVAITDMAERDWLRLPVVSAGAEYLVMGHLMRRNILAYKAPPNNEGYDLICIHPDPRHVPSNGELAQVRVQVKSRYATDCDRGFPIKEASLGAFDFLIVAFLNIGKFYGNHDGSEGAREPEFYTLPNAFIRQHHDATSSWQKVRLKNLEREIEPYAGEAGFEQIAQILGIAKPVKQKHSRSKSKRLASKIKGG
ncbi:MAG: hypothetical protein AAB658_13325 [Chloroflexota bacterium]